MPHIRGTGFSREIGGSGDRYAETVPAPSRLKPAPQKKHPRSDRYFKADERPASPVSQNIQRIGDDHAMLVAVTLGGDLGAQRGMAQLDAQLLQRS